MKKTLLATLAVAGAMLAAPPGNPPTSTGSQVTRSTNHTNNKKKVRHNRNYKHRQTTQNTHQ